MLQETTQTPNRNAVMLVRIRKSDMGAVKKTNFFFKKHFKSLSPQIHTTLLLGRSILKTEEDGRFKWNSS